MTEDKRFDLSQLSVAQLKERAADLRKTVFSLRMDLATNKLKNYRTIRNTRRDLARTLTALRQRNMPVNTGGKG